MSIFVYAPVIRQGTRELIEALNAKRLVKHDGFTFRYKGLSVQFDPKDAIICWGEHVPPVTGVLTINACVRYTNQLRMNILLATELNKLGRVAINAQPMALDDYTKGLASLREHNNTPQVGVFKQLGAVPMEEFPGYGTHYYQFNGQGKVTMLCNKVLSHTVQGSRVGSGTDREADIALARATLDTYGLDFGVVSTAVLYPGTILARKIITSPALTAEEAVALAKTFKLYIEEKQCGSQSS